MISGRAPRRSSTHRPREGGDHHGDHHPGSPQFELEELRISETIDPMVMGCSGCSGCGPVENG
ncbi:hypothetical protein ACFQV2_24640 [Actinokineospora soli]|uniref:Uncharacterized protein n=1 Tax=Actinokineospora soli TaxID=1048753 RepID=A0ABW2TTR1_9PSEU